MARSRRSWTTSIAGWTPRTSGRREPDRRFGIALTPHARQQLEAEMAWSRRRWGRRHQQSFRKALLVRLNAIAANPYALAIRPEAGAEVQLARHGLEVMAN